MDDYDNKTMCDIADTMLTMAINVNCITDLCSLSGAGAPSPSEPSEVFSDYRPLGWIITIQIAAPEHFEILIVGVGAGEEGDSCQ